MINLKSGINLLDNKILFFLSVFACMSFCLVHLTNDFYCFIGWARETYNSDTSGLALISETWEIKGYLSRVFYLQLYSLASIFADDRTLLFQFIFKFIGFVELSLLSLISACLLPKEYRISGSSLKTFYVLTICCFSTHYACHLQPEFISSFVIILSVCLYLRNEIVSSIFAGILLGLCFFLKSPIPFLGVAVWAVALAMKGIRSFKEEIISILPLGISMIVCIVLALLVLKIEVPQELIDITDAATYQASDAFSILLIAKTLILSIGCLFLNIWYIPAIFILFIGFSVFRGKELALWAISFLACLFYIVIANTVFIYHYSVFLIPTVFVACKLCEGSNNVIVPTYLLLFTVFIISIIEIITFSGNGFISNKYFWLSLSIVLVISLQIKKFYNVSAQVIISASFVVYVTFISCLSYNTIKGNSVYALTIRENQRNNKLQMLQNEKEIMYLDAGTGVFFCGAHSYLRYIYPLPIQRINEYESSFVTSKTFVGTKQKILEYKGDFLTMGSEWFYKYPHETIEQFINQNYALDSHISTCIFSWEMYPAIPAIQHETLELYKKIIIK